MHILPQVELHSVPDSLEPLLYVHIDAFFLRSLLQMCGGSKQLFDPLHYF